MQLLSTGARPVGRFRPLCTSGCVVLVGLNGHGAGVGFRWRVYIRLSHLCSKRGCGGPARHRAAHVGRRPGRARASGVLRRTPAYALVFLTPLASQVMAGWCTVCLPRPRTGAVTTFDVDHACRPRPIETGMSGVHSPQWWLLGVAVRLSCGGVRSTSTGRSCCIPECVTTGASELRGIRGDQLVPPAPPNFPTGTPPTMANRS